MGEARKEALRVDFDSQIKLEFHGAAITSDAGLVAYRELDEALGVTRMADDMFRDPRHGKNTPTIGGCPWFTHTPNVRPRGIPAGAVTTGRRLDRGRCRRAGPCSEGDQPRRSERAQPLRH